MIRLKSDKILFSLIGYFVICTFSLICLLPFLMVISGSFTDESAIFKYGYGFIPPVFSTAAYRLVFKSPTSILYAYMVSVGITAVGTAVSLFLTAMTGYVLQKKEFRSRNVFSLYIYFTTLFSGGLVPWYILMYKYLHMKDNFLAMIIPLLFNAFYIIVIRSFMKSIPDAITESAKIDGAKEFYIFIRIIMPLSKPALATIGMFIALNYWNDWYNAMLYIQDEKMFPLQYFLYRLLNNIEFAKSVALKNPKISVINLPGESFKLAMTVVATGPIVLLYPFVQQYFVKGLTIGSVKG